MTALGRCLAVLTTLAVAGCSSDSTTDPGDASGDAGAGGAGAGGAGEGSGGAATRSGGAPSGAGGSPASGGAVNASDECVAFCDCMAEYCTDQVFPGGCLPECAAQSSWDLPCRHNMCTLVPYQPENGHCIHAMGEGECLDAP